MRIGSAGSTNINLLQSDIFTFRNEDFVVDTGGAFENGQTVVALAANVSQIQLLNPVASGITVLVDSFSASLSLAGEIAWGRLDTALAVLTAEQSNKKIGAANKVAQVRIANNPIRQGSVLARRRLAANITTTKGFKYPIELTPGIGFIIETVAVNVTLSSELDWREV